MKKIKKNILILLFVITNMSLFSQTIYERGNITNDTIKVEEISIISSYKATKETPFSFTNLEKKYIELRGELQEPAGLLQYTPSITYNTDNGLFSGYSYYRLRGIDQTRINITFNGVPMNEPEDQGIYFNNYPNFLQNVSDIQIIRGAGVSKSGVSSYGGSINFDSKEIEYTPEMSILYGSYNTMNLSGKANLNKGFIRASFLSTDGYKYHSSNESYSIFYGLKPFQNSKLIGFVGKQFNQMAWIGSPIDKIEKDRRINANTEDEKDEFLYVHNQFHYKLKNINAVFYHTYLNGWYNMDFGHFDGNFGNTMYKLSLNSHWLGTNINVNIFPNTILGISTYTYKRNHDNAMAYPVDYESYNKNYGLRKELSPYLKTNYKLGSFNFYGDIQYRYTTFDYHDITSDFDLEQHKWNFFNWSFGLTLNVTDKIHLYSGIGENNREPTRTDLFGGYDEYYEENYSNIVPEKVEDFETGIKFYGNNLYFNLNGFIMTFEDEIVLNGKVGPNSIIIHSNVAESSRKGIELDLKYNLLKNLKIINVTSLSNNTINQDTTEITHVLSPSFITSSDIVYQWKKLTSGVNIRYNGESFIDFANEYKLPSYILLNFYSSLKFNNFILSFRLNNILDELYYTYGNIGFDVNPAYFQQAGINFNISLNYSL